LSGRIGLPAYTQEAQLSLLLPANCGGRASAIFKSPSCRSCCAHNRTQERRKNSSVAELAGSGPVRHRAPPVAPDHHSAPSAPRTGATPGIGPLISWNWVNNFRRHGPLRNGPLPLLCATIAASRSRMSFSRRARVGAQPPSRSRKTRRERLRRISPSCRSCCVRLTFSIRGLSAQLSIAHC
jgi:hypothetical protein